MNVVYMYPNCGEKTSCIACMTSLLVDLELARDTDTSRI